MKEKRPAYLALLSICIIWGTTYLVLRIGVMHFPAFLFSAIRQTGAGLLLGLGYFLFAKNKRLDKKNVLRQAFAGFLMIGLGNGLVGWAETNIPSGVAALICSMMPVWVIVINMLSGKGERPNTLIYSGIAAGVMGMMLVFREHLSEFSSPIYLFGIILTIVAAISWAYGAIWSKSKSAGTDPFLNAALQMFFGGISMFVMSAFFDSYQDMHWTGSVILSLLYLMIFGSLIAFAAYAYALSRLPVTIVSLYAYVNPMIAVVMGWLVLNEKLNLFIILAFALTVSGIYLVNRGHKARRAKEALAAAIQEKLV